MSYAQSPSRSRRAFMGEDYQFSTVIRDADGAPSDLTGATVSLVLFPYGMEGSALTAALMLTERVEGEVAGIIAAQDIYDATTPGLYRYQVKVSLDNLIRVGESGLLTIVGGEV